MHCGVERQPPGHSTLENQALIYSGREAGTGCTYEAEGLDARGLPVVLRLMGEPVGCYWGWSVGMDERVHDRHPGDGGKLKHCHRPGYHAVVAATPVDETQHT